MPDSSQPPSSGAPEAPAAADPAAHEVVAPDRVDRSPGSPDGEHPPEQPSEELISPAKIIRIGAMVKQLLEEVRGFEMDEPARDQLRDIYENSLAELKGALSPDLAAELDRLALDFGSDTVPSAGQLRIAKAQLVGWLEGLFHGIQATLVAQQMAARQQLEGMRGELPERAMPGGPGYI